MTNLRNGASAVDVRVLTVDDQPVFRGIAREVIDATPGLESPRLLKRLWSEHGA